jgi:outer membrane protein assembly factor BamB
MEVEQSTYMRAKCTLPQRILVKKLDENTGKVKMEFEAPAVSNLKARAIPNFFIADGRIFVSYNGVAVYNITTGELFWKSSSSTGEIEIGNAGATAAESSFVYISRHVPHQSK